MLCQNISAIDKYGSRPTKLLRALNRVLFFGVLSSL